MAPLETTVRSHIIKLTVSHCYWICITLVLMGFLQRTFGWRYWFAGSRRCLGLRSMSLFATLQVRTVHTHMHKPTLCRKLCNDPDLLCVPSTSPLYSLAAISGKTHTPEMQRYHSYRKKLGGNNLNYLDLARKI